MTGRLIDRELAVARERIETLRTEIENASGPGWFQKLGQLLLRQKMYTRAEMAVPFLEDAESLYAQLNAPPPDPQDFKAVEEAIDHTSQNVLEQIAEQATYDAKIQEMFKANEVVFTLERAQNAGSPLGFENLEALCRGLRSLRIYKLALQSEALQHKRHEFLPDFLRQAKGWDDIAYKVEIRKRRDQLAKVEAEPLPKVNLLTSDVALPQILASQQRFLTELIADLEEIRQGVGGKASCPKSQKDEINDQIRDCEQEIKGLEADSQMDESSRRRRLNILSRKRDSLYEALESLT